MQRLQVTSQPPEGTQLSQHRVRCQDQAMGKSLLTPGHCIGSTKLKKLFQTNFKCERLKNVSCRWNINESANYFSIKSREDERIAALVWQIWNLVCHLLSFQYQDSRQKLVLDYSIYGIMTEYQVTEKSDNLSHCNALLHSPSTYKQMQILLSHSFPE